MASAAVAITGTARRAARAAEAADGGSGIRLWYWIA